MMPRSWGKTMEECRKKQGRMAKASEEGLGPKWAVVPLLMLIYVKCEYFMNLKKGKR